MCSERHTQGSGVETPQAAVLLGGPAQIASLRWGHFVDVTRMRRKTSGKPQVAGTAGMRARGGEVGALAGARDHGAFASSPAVPTSPAPGPPSGTRTQSQGLSGVDKLSTNGQELLTIRERFSKPLLCLDPAVAPGLQDWASPLQAAPPRSAEDTLMLRFGVWGLYFCPQLSQPSAPQPPHLGPPGHAPSSAAGARTPAGPGAPGLSCR